ncbi:MAG: DUF1788 domain-containing protein [Actinomycetes bacterium]
MSAIDEACEAYERHLHEPWATHVSGPERVWMLVYRPADERRLLHRLPMFETTTIAQGKKWMQLDISGRFEDWLNNHEYRDEYLADPELLQHGALDEFAERLCDGLRTELQAADDQTVVGLIGAPSLFGMLRLSSVISAIAGDVPGRLLVFFPGTRHDNNYRLLDGYDGWNYLAVPIN